MYTYSRLIRPFALILAGASLLLGACDSSDPGNDPGAGEEELITRIVLTFTAPGSTVSATATDPDGDGTDFTIDTITLDENTEYVGTVQVFDDVNNENIGDEISEEDDEHQFFFTAGGDAAGSLTIIVTDEDGNGLPVGLEFNATTGTGGSVTGTLRVVLSHYDEAPKNGTTPSDETDIDVVFPLVIN